MLNWLSNWYSNHHKDAKARKPNPYAKNDDGSFYKAALLSGPPGVGIAILRKQFLILYLLFVFSIGKTTTAALVCKELGFSYVEFNASDTRSKRLLKEEVSDLLSNKSLSGYIQGNSKCVTKKHVLIMDEVDGMAGNEDRGGVQELIGLIKESSIPIICMCNNRNHQKLKSFVTNCYDLRFIKPRLDQIKGRMMSICFRENLKLPSHKIEEIISASNNDIRQTINYLSLLSSEKSLLPTSDSKHIIEKDNDKTAQKDLPMVHCEHSFFLEL